MINAPTFDRPTSSLKDRYLAIKWGGSTLVSLYISVLSGIVVALLYDPAEPFYSTSTIELVAPYGSFWRGLHYYSSQAFLLLLACHFLAAIWENTHYYSRVTWIRLSASLPLALLLLFTGYILRDDATGEAAGLIAENILLSVPMLGEWLNDLLFAVTTAGVNRVYANHLAGLMVLGAICVWPHLRRYPARWRDHLPLTVVLLALAVLFSAPVEPQRFGLLHIAGPWFFLGLQEALRSLPAFWAGVVLPAIPLAALFALPHRGKKRTVYLVLLALWLVGYVVLTGVSYSRM